MITIFEHFLRPGKQGGVELFLRNLIEGFENASIPIERAGAGRGKLISSRFVREQVDILHAVGKEILFPNYYVPPVSFGVKQKVSVIHDLLFKTYPDSLPAAKVAWLECSVPLSILRSDKIIAISEFTKNEILEHYGSIVSSEKIVVIPNPISLSRFPKGAPLEGYVFDEPFVLCPSSGFWHKNVPFLIELFASARELSRFKLLVVGQRPSELGWTASKAEFRNQYERLLSSGGAVELGFVPDKVLGELYRRAHAVAFPSLYEGFGMPIFEAAMLGAKVVCAEVGAVRDLHCEGISIVRDRDDPDAWVSAIHEERRGPSAEQLRDMQRKLSPSQVARDYAAVFAN